MFDSIRVQPSARRSLGLLALLLLALLLLALLLLVACGGDRDRERAPESETVDRDAFVRAMSLGKAHFENKETALAVESFTTATELDPRSPAAWRNLARAHLLGRDFAAAEAALGRAAELESESVATSYLLGIVAVRQTRFEDALPHLEKAVALDPETAPLRYQLASAYQNVERHDDAIEALRETARLDPLHTTAHYKLAAYAQKAGDRREFEARQRDFLRLRKLFGDEGRSTEALEASVYTRAETVAPEPQPAPRIEVRFVEAAGVDPVAGDLAWTAIFEAAGATSGQVAVGNFFDPVDEDESYDPAVHAHDDAALISAEGVRLLLGEGDGSYEDVTAEAGLGAAAARRGAWIDYEVDGDLDLALATDRGVELWQNNGDGTFEQVGASVGLDASGSFVDLAVADLDGNGGLDLVAAGEAATVVLENQRTGSFRRRPDPPGPWPAARRVLLDDLDHDTRPDAVLLTTSELLIVPGAGGDRQRLRLGLDDPAFLATLDADNDGRLDLLVAGAGGIRLWRNQPGEWVDVSEATGLTALDGELTISDVVVADHDGDGDGDVLLITPNGPRLLRNDGGERRPRLEVRLLGSKTNPGGLGTRVEIRQGDFVASRTVDRLPVAFGLGDRGLPDVLRVEWTNGIIDNQVEFPELEGASSPLAVTVVEKNVASGSCPFLYAWDGDGFRFVTDLLGNSPLGLSRARGVPLDADPDEYVEVGQLPLRDGRYVLQVTEEMREALYLDQVRLVAVDHPPAVEIHPTDKLMPAPFPRSELIALAGLRPPRRVVSDDGGDRTAALERIDGELAAPGVLLPPPLRGMTRPLALTFDFGPLDETRPLVLALTGWLQYGDASTNIALSQGAAPVLMPRLEVETGRGFEPLDVVVGLPAGKTKTILVDLEGQLPPDGRRLRLTTNVEVRWDRVALGEKLPPAEQHVLEPSSARLFERGFSEIRSRAPGHPTTPAHAALRPRPPWNRSLEGWATRHGDVLELVSERDEELAVIVGGDAIELAFAAALPPVPAGLVRTFFFYSVGWDKDGDHNVIDGDRIEPLPVAAALLDEAEDWQLRYSTRWIAGDRFRDRGSVRRDQLFAHRRAW